MPSLTYYLMTDKEIEGCRAYARGIRTPEAREGRRAYLRCRNLLSPSLRIDRLQRHAADRIAAGAKPRHGPKHGSESMYINRGCRCALCVAARSRACRGRRAAKRVKVAA